MLNNLIKSVLPLLGLLVFICCTVGTRNIEVYISPDGNDQNAGTQTAPLKSIEKARDIVRVLRKGSPDKTVVVYLGGGIYPVEHPVVFTTDDSGNKNAPVIYKAKEGEKPVFTGSKMLKNWEVLKDETKLGLLDPAVRGKVYSVDLKSAGITDFGDPTELGKRPELFCNQQLQTLARWPNKGLTFAGKVKGETELPPTYIKVRGTKEGIFEYLDKHQNRWNNEKDAGVGGYWYWDWSEECQQVGKIDTISQTICLREPYHQYGYKDGLRYFGLNLFCEIDQPGEWYLNRESGILYWYPPEGVDPARAEVSFSLFSAPYLIEMKGCSYLTLQGLSLQESRGSAVSMSNCNHCLISNCRIERFGSDGIHLIDGFENGISGCLLSTFGCGGTIVKGGDRKNLTPANHFIENTVIENFSLFKRTYEPAVNIEGCGIRISNNLFRNSSSSAMRLEGNDCTIEYNRISHVVNESDDQGGLDMFYNPSLRGNIIRYNYWSDISGGTRHGAAGVRFDDMISGVTVYGNLFERCGVLQFGAVQIHGGKDNLVENNLFYKCFAAVSCSPWGAERWLKALDSPVIRKKIYEDVDINSPIYQKKYPQLKNVRLNADRNTVVNNLMVDCEHMFMKNNHALVLNNNDSIRSNGNGIEKFCDPGILKKHGLKSIPFQKIGPKKNPWFLENRDR